MTKEEAVSLAVRYHTYMTTSAEDKDDKQVWARLLREIQARVGLELVCRSSLDYFASGA